MKNRHVIGQRIAQTKEENKKLGMSSQLQWWQLSLIGIGSIIGAGFFLGTSLSIRMAGPAILINYLVAGITAFIVFSALAEMTVRDPAPGSFRTYSKKAFGRSFGYTVGWMYWTAGVLIMSSEVVALATFTQFWFPQVPLWVFSIMFAAVAFAINFLGVKNFGKIESMFAMIKLSTLIIFVVFGVLLFTNLISPHAFTLSGKNISRHFFPNGIIGMWTALIFVFFSFGGIEIVGIASSELKNKREVPKAGIGMLLALVAVYCLSIFIVLSMVSWKSINASKSPFVTALSVFHIPYLDSIFNIIIISAAFSTMVGALFSVTNILLSLAEDGDAPTTFARRNANGTPIRALLLTGIALGAFLAISYVLPGTIYEYVTSAAGVIQLINWIIILCSQIKLRQISRQENLFQMPGFPTTSYIGIALILISILGGFLHNTQRMGVLISLSFIAIIFISRWIIFRPKNVVGIRKMREDN